MLGKINDSIGQFSRKLFYERLRKEQLTKRQGAYFSVAKPQNPDRVKHLLEIAKKQLPVASMNLSSSAGNENVIKNIKNYIADNNYEAAFTEASFEATSSDTRLISNPSYVKLNHIILLAFLVSGLKDGKPFKKEIFPHVSYQTLKDVLQHKPNGFTNADLKAFHEICTVYEAAILGIQSHQHSLIDYFSPEKKKAAQEKNYFDMPLPSDFLMSHFSGAPSKPNSLRTDLSRKRK